ncbi:sugar phosphate nucleotidyltransferase [Paenibacillus sacheonensis]|uniref:Glucose-1-phosphate thymidylyltransferase n=1 Tax=Paenibacillus sacheonensis TaxID=742054 RepID=A0A7X5C0G5_9BACL|nr:sugar phosphate nucleotidyltransferase [Paenibacillus sacheonensis]MBM7566721.1 glucose-1-phosphate thymidylyltransferase [Paenibacillus sacheonensis]NBC71702.1 NTP transferase domain-containing protein [Paenibacillus sacheonensis]
MKAVILAGGTGTRLLPLTKLLNKHLLPVGRLPMICYSLISLQAAGITDILLVTAPKALGDFASFLGSGKDYGVSLTYRIQEEAGGIAQALELARPFIGSDDKFIVLLGDNLFEEPLKPHMDAFRSQASGAMVLLKQVPDPERYGVPVFDGGGRIIHIDEKPAAPQTDSCVTGIYMYDGTVFDLIAEQSPSQRGELEITDVNNAFAGKGKLEHRHLSGWWTDAGTFDSLLEANRKLMGDIT